MIDISTVTPEERKIIEARREYQRIWRATHKDRIQEHYQEHYGLTLLTEKVLIY